jgi:hypothetical protein
MHYVLVSDTVGLRVKKVYISIAPCCFYLLIYTPVLSVDICHDALATTSHIALALFVVGVTLVALVLSAANHKLRVTLWK